MNLKAEMNKLDGNCNVICRKSDIARWRKLLARKDQSLSQAIRDILNRECSMRETEEMVNQNKK